MKTSQILTIAASSDYELLDSGEGEKLERFGSFLLARPDPQALWQKRLSATEWKKADAFFTRNSDQADWTLRSKVPDKWEISFAGLKFWIKLTAFKHTGLFPEQEVNWSWLEKMMGANRGQTSRSSELRSDLAGDYIEVLNLFGYTGGATLACAKAGAKVVHIDGSKAAVTWAHENADLSGLEKAPIRWIVEDARFFVEREIRRGRQYDGIIMDPPAFGHGPESELWKIEENLLPLIEDCKKLLKPKPLFFLINGYAAGYSAVAYENILLELKEKYGGEIEIGELTIGEARSLESGARSESQMRLLPCGIFARWSL